MQRPANLSAQYGSTSSTYKGAAEKEDAQPNEALKRTRKQGPPVVRNTTIRPRHLSNRGRLHKPWDSRQNSQNRNSVAHWERPQTHNNGSFSSTFKHTPITTSRVNLPESSSGSRSKPWKPQDRPSLHSDNGWSGSRRGSNRVERPLFVPRSDSPARNQPHNYHNNRSLHPLPPKPVEGFADMFSEPHSPTYPQDVPFPSHRPSNDSNIKPLKTTTRTPNSIGPRRRNSDHKITHGHGKETTVFQHQPSAPTPAPLSGKRRQSSPVDVSSAFDTSFTSLPTVSEPTQHRPSPTDTGATMSVSANAPLPSAKKLSKRSASVAELLGTQPEKQPTPVASSSRQSSLVERKVEQNSSPRSKRRKVDVLSKSFSRNDHIPVPLPLEEKLEYPPDDTNREAQPSSTGDGTFPPSLDESTGNMIIQSPVRNTRPQTRDLTPSKSPKVTIKLESPAPPSLTIEPAPQLKPSALKRWPLPLACQRTANPAGFTAARQAFLEEKVAWLRKRRVKIGEYKIREDGMVIEWTSETVPLWTDTLLPEHGTDLAAAVTRGEASRGSATSELPNESPMQSFPALSTPAGPEDRRASSTRSLRSQLRNSTTPSTFDSGAREDAQPSLAQSSMSPQTTRARIAAISAMRQASRSASPLVREASQGYVPPPPSEVIVLDHDDVLPEVDMVPHPEPRATIPLIVRPSQVIPPQGIIPPKKTFIPVHAPRIAERQTSPAEDYAPPPPPPSMFVPPLPRRRKVDPPPQAVALVAQPSRDVSSAVIESVSEPGACQENRSLDPLGLDVPSLEDTATTVPVPVPVPAAVPPEVDKPVKAIASHAMDSKAVVASPVVVKEENKEDDMLCTETDEELEVDEMISVDDDQRLLESAAEFLHRYVHTFDANRAELAGAYSPDATLSTSIHENGGISDAIKFCVPLSNDHESSRTGRKQVYQGISEICSRLSTLGPHKLAYDRWICGSKPVYDIGLLPFISYSNPSASNQPVEPLVSASFHITAVHSVMKEISKADVVEYHNIVTVDHSFVLKPVSAQTGGAQRRVGEQEWPLVAVAHQMVFRSGCLTTVAEEELETVFPWLPTPTMTGSEGQ